MLKFIISFVFCILALVAFPQGSDAIFEDFESQDNNRLWHLNVTRRPPTASFLNDFKNRWRVSHFEPYMGDSCLIITNNQGVSAEYSDSTCSAVAYKEFDLLPGEYDLSFMWRVMGETSNKDGFYVVFVPSELPIKFYSSIAGLPRGVVENSLWFGNNASKRNFFSGSTSWSSASTKVTVSSQSSSAKYRLYFIWDNNSSFHMPPAACIDNIQLVKTACAKPDNVVVTSDKQNASLSVAWQGVADSYDIMYRGSVRGKVDTIYNVSSKAYIFNDLVEDVYDVWVRANCAGKHSAWVPCLNTLLYLQDGNGCVDYLDLGGAGVCKTGSYSSRNDKVEKVDFGYASKDSRHTIHYIPGERDVWSTEGKLSTVPSGEVASVRLGNPVTGGGQESVTYSYTLGPKDKKILLIKYAVVFEKPGHDMDNEFTLEVLDENDNLLQDNKQDSCSFTQFFANSDDLSWNTATDYLGEEILWKDWTTVGLDLTKYSGMTIKVRISTVDCGKLWHYTYAYFTVSCVDAKMSGYTCGEAAEFSVSAPDGFKYSWYHPDRPNDILSTSKSFSIDKAKADTFYCEMTSTENEGCKLTLPAYLVPRMPKSKFEPQWIPANCENRVKFQNLAGVVSDDKITGEQCEFVEWAIIDVSKSDTTVFEDKGSPVWKFPPQGDTLDILMVTGINGNQCTDTLIRRYIVPPIGPVDTTIYATICNGSSFDISGKKYTEAGVYEISEKTIAGCDSIVRLDLKVINSLDTLLFDTICYGDTLYLGDIPCTRPNTYMRTIKSSGGCDSVIRLQLEVIPKVNIEFAPLSDICESQKNFNLGFSIDQGEVLAYSLKFDSLAINRGFVNVDNQVLPADDYIAIDKSGSSIIPDVYSVDIVFHTAKCGNVVKNLEFTVLYDQFGVFTQKWNDVLAVFNPEHCVNHYEFSAFQWYKNDRPIAGAVNSYLYLNSDSVSSSDIYRVSLVRKGETRAILSCPYRMTDSSRDQKTDYIVLQQVKAGAKLKLASPLPQSGKAVWYSVSGQIVAQYDVESMTEEINAPTLTGIYLLRLIFPTEAMTYKISVIR